MTSRCLCCTLVALLCAAPKSAAAQATPSATFRRAAPGVPADVLGPDPSRFWSLASRWKASPDTARTNDAKRTDWWRHARPVLLTEATAAALSSAGYVSSSPNGACC